MTVLSNGWILACADGSYNYTPDSPGNIDNSVTISKDGGATWEWTLVNHFKDHADTSATLPSATGKTSPERENASFIDPAVAQGSDGTVYLLIDALPSRAGLACGGGPFTATGSGFTDAGDPLLTSGPRSMDQADYTPFIDCHDPRILPRADGSGDVVLNPVKDLASGTLRADTYVDGDFNLWTAAADAATPSMTTQADTGDPVQDNVFYGNAAFKLYPTYFVCLRRGIVTDSGITWGPMELLNVKADNEQFLGMCPGRGTEVTRADGGKRVVFQVYDTSTGRERSSCIYSDDNGDTWHRGERTMNFVDGTDKTSEAQTIQLPDGRLRMYVRNGSDYKSGRPGLVRVTDSFDGGRSWGPTGLDQDLPYCGNCEVSVVAMGGTLVGPDGRRYGNLVLASYPRGPEGVSRRSNGIVRVGSLGDDGTETWLNGPDAVRYKGQFYYSCLAPASDGTINLLYETDTDDPAVKATGVSAGKISFDRFPVTDLLGPGWTFETAAPSTPDPTPIPDPTQTPDPVPGPGPDSTPGGASASSSPSAPSAGAAAPKPAPVSNRSSDAHTGTVAETGDGPTGMLAPLVAAAALLAVPAVLYAAFRRR